MCDYDNAAKASVPQTPYHSDMQGAALGRGYRSSPLEEMQKASAEIEQRHTKLSEGIEFFRENPAFNKFVELIRKGSISI